MFTEFVSSREPPVLQICPPVNLVLGCYPPHQVILVYKDIVTGQDIAIARYTQLLFGLHSSVYARLPIRLALRV